MKVVFSRKGFDSSSGGGPSPIVDGRPVSLPIPSAGHSHTRWDDLGLGDHVERASRGRWRGADLCHHDPMFLPDGSCLFGQCGAAQAHLANRGVGPGDIFLFFGLFAGEGEGPHHRMFGYLEVAEAHALASMRDDVRRALAAQGHPHAIAPHSTNDVIYRGKGRLARTACDGLRLTAAGENPSVWSMPDWLQPGGLSYHDRPSRWLPNGKLRAVSRGQEFVADIGRREKPRKWLDAIRAMIDG